ncbi:GNAT family N-acetyltransferase [Roseovarius sp.]|uniref:GNAT family N-acetyltransferase n=1 Tax=Roseovarius sp. TaxID=1486281 RepID=UPI003B5C98E7
MDLNTWAGARQPERTVLEGRFTRLEPLDAATHGEALFNAVSGPDAERLHRWLADPVPEDLPGFLERTDAMARAPDPMFFAVIDRATGRVEGRQSLMDIDTAHGRAEIGHILWGPRISRSPVTTEAFFLLTDHAFNLGFRRWQWRCHASNALSRNAAARFGFTFEGIFRNHMVVKGKNRDTAWHSILDREWPHLRTGFLDWLAPSNFDAQGQQRAPLSAFLSASSDI